MALIALIFFHFCLLKTYAQTFYDQNCEEQIRSQNYIKGTHDAQKRTERIFNYDLIFKNYQNNLNEVESLPFKTIDSKALCLKEKNLKNCLGFKTYCLESFISDSIKEDLERRIAAWKNCQDETYKSRFPTHCQGELEKNLNHTHAQALRFANLNLNKSSKQNQFTTKTQSIYEPFKNNQAQLTKWWNKQNQDHQNNTDISKILDQCHGISLIDDKDVKNRNTSLELGLGFKTQCELDLSHNPDTLGARDLREEISKISKFSASTDFLPHILDSSLSLFIMSYLSTQQKYYGTADTDLKNKFCTDFPKVCTSKNLVSKLDQSLKDYNQKKVLPIEQLTHEKIIDIYNNSILDQIEGMNTTCKKAKNEYQNIDKKYQCFPLNVDLKKPNTPAPPVISQSECERRRDQAQDEFKSLENKYRLPLRNYQKNIMSSDLGHLFLTESFRKKLGFLNPDDTYQKCMKGSGKVYNHLTVDDIRKSMRDYDQRLKDETSSIIEDITSPKLSSLELGRKYLINNILAVSKALKDNPSEMNAKYVCTLIRDLHAKDYQTMLVENISAGASAVCAVALSMTGIGSVAAPFLLAGTVGGSVVYAGQSINNFLDNMDNNNRLTVAAITQQTDFEKALEKIKKSEDHKDSEFSSLIALLSFEALTLGAANPVKLVNGLKSIKNLSYILRGTKTLSHALDAQEISKIKNGLERLRDGLKKINIDPKTLNHLNAEEMMELGSFISKTEDFELNNILKLLKNSKHPLYGKVLLESLRQTNYTINTEKLALLLKKYPKLHFPNGKEMTSLIDRSTNLINEIKPKTYRSLSLDLVKKAGKWLPSYLKKYGQDFKKSKGLRLILKTRKEKTPELTRGQKMMGYLNEPIATFFNTSKKLSTPASIFVFINTVDRGLAHINENLFNKNYENALKGHEGYPGGFYAAELDASGLIEKESINKIFKDHKIQFNKWLESEGSFEMPRINEIARLYNLSSNEKNLLNQYSFEAYNEAYKVYLESDATGTPEEKYNFYNHIIKLVNQKIQDEPDFKRFSDIEKDSMSLTLYPVFKIIPSGKTDVEITKEIFNNTNPYNEGLLRAMSDGSFSFTEAISIKQFETTNEKEYKKQIDEKINWAKNNLPPDLQFVATRIDIPRSDSPLYFPSFKGDGEILNNELERWKFLATDKRFKEDYKTYLTSLKSTNPEEIYPQSTVILLIEVMALSYEKIYTTLKTKDKLGDTYVDEFLDNPLFEAVNYAFEQSGLDDNEIKRRKKILVEKHYAPYYREELNISRAELIEQVKYLVPEIKVTE